MKANRGMYRDANSIPIQGMSMVETKVMTLAGGTTDDPGDYDGTGNPATLFTVTGEVLLVVFGSCDTNLAGDSATIEVGFSGNTAALIAQTTATDIDDGDVWLDATPGVGGEALGSSAVFVVNDGADVIQTVATANITAGVLNYFCLWRPLSSDGNVVAA